PQAWREAVEKQGGSLTREDAAIVEALADTLGQCDLDGQLSSLSHAKALLAMQLAAARERCESHGKLYRTMGLLAGAFVVVFFI
ncbi:stage III sporulation protein AB, partial [Anaerotruncus massiliensis (ex Liu et al. 2021)]|uniref:stage III sporulation protein AB n=2 Tax=Oscillospiraceae TaxID=216572 RepID=UPI003AB70BCA